MTHELRSPLNSILGYTQVLLRNLQVQGWIREAVETMQHSGQHMHALIDGSLELARIEAGRVRLELAPLPLPRLVDDVAAMLQPQAQAKGLRFEVQVLGTMPAWIRGDAKRLRQILINLLANAVRFTDHGLVLLRLDFRRHVARIDVVDTGIGIAPQDQARIFLPFERGSAGRRSGGSGTGLGLTITHLLTELMGGELSVESRPGQGSTFTVRVYLPEAPHEPGRTVHDDAAAVRPVIGYLAPRRRLLVVDDQPLQRQLLAALLMPLGFEVLEAASGRECLEVVEHSHCDAVLLDIQMDDLDGWQTAALLRQRYRAERLPIVFVSADLFDHRPQLLQQLQCSGPVGKPVLESELLDALGRALQLEWVRADSTPVPAPPAPVAGGTATLPPGLRATLRPLVRQGNASALRTHLRAAAQAHPDHAAALAALTACAERFDFDALAALLRDDEEDADEPNP